MQYWSWNAIKQLRQFDMMIKQEEEKTNNWDEDDKQKEDEKNKQINKTMRTRRGNESINQ